MEDDDGNYLAYFEEDDNGRKKSSPPSHQDWINTKVFIQFSGYFYAATLTFSASLTITSSLCFHELCLLHLDLVNWSTKKRSFVG